MRLGCLVSRDSGDRDVVGILDCVFRNSYGEGYGPVFSLWNFDRGSDVSYPAGRIFGAGELEVNRVIASALVVKQDVDGECLLRVCLGVGQHGGHAELVVLVDCGNCGSSGIDIQVLVLGANRDGGEIDVESLVVLLLLDRDRQVHQCILAGTDVNLGVIEVGRPARGPLVHRKADGVVAGTLVLDDNIIDHEAAGVAVLLRFVNQQVNLVFLVDRHRHRGSVVGVGFGFVGGAIDCNRVIAEIGLLVNIDRQVDRHGLAGVKVDILDNRAPVRLLAFERQVDAVVAVALVLDRNRVAE